MHTLLAAVSMFCLAAVGFELGYMRAGAVPPDGTRSPLTARDHLRTLRRVFAAVGVLIMLYAGVSSLLWWIPIEEPLGSGWRRVSIRHGLSTFVAGLMAMFLLERWREYVSGSIQPERDLTAVGD